MRPAPGSLQSFLAANRSFIIADLFTFVTVYGGGEIFPYSGYTIPFTVPAGYFDQYSVHAGQTRSFALGPKFGRTKTQTKIGVQVDTIDILIYAGAADLIGTLTWQEAFFGGVFDGATVELGRLVLSTAPGGGIAIIGHVVWFQGIVGDVEIGRTAIDVKLNSTLTQLSTQYPRRLWQHDCSHVFGDAMCQFDRQSMAATVTAQAGSTQSAITTGFNPSPATLYDHGTIIGLGGANNGLKRSIAAANSGGIAFLTAPFVYPVQVGDAFSMLPGCDHNIQTCLNVFNNLAHFGGQPYIPPSEFAI